MFIPGTYGVLFVFLKRTQKEKKTEPVFFDET